MAHATVDIAAATAVGDDIQQPYASLEQDPAPVKFVELFRFADWKDKSLMFMGFLSALALGASLPGFSQLFGDLLNDLLQGQKKIDKISLELTMCGVFAWITGWVAVSCYSITGERQTRALRKAFFSAILKQEVALFDLNKAGELANRLSSDVTVISNAIGPKVANLTQYLATFLFSYAFAFYRCWRLTLVMLTVLPVLMGAGAVLGKVLSTASEKAQQAYAQGGGIAQEVLSSIRTVQAFDALERECQRYNEKIRQAEKVGVWKGFYVGTSVGSTLCILFSSYALAFWYGSYLVEWGLSNGGEIVSVFFCVLIGGFQLGVAAPVVAAMNEAKGAARKVHSIIDRAPAMNADEHAAGAVLPSLTGHIEFRSVAFRYPSRPDAPIFKDFSLVIRPGQKVALVGPSGSGKSSVVSLIERFYDVDAGEILIDGVPVRDLNLHWWRAQVGIVTQEPTLFSASILENIQWANPNASKADIVQACKDAFIHDVIDRLPHGYDTHVGEGGSQLSGGQKQRVAIARAIIKNPKILLLDEATSALDRNSETIVQQALNNVMQGRTVITIAHRLVIIQDADLICFIQPRDPQAPEGSVAWYSQLLESGTHDTLMESNGEYAQMVYAQQQASDVASPPTPGQPQEGGFAEAEGSGGGSMLTGAQQDATAAGPDKGPQAQNAVWRTAKVNSPEWVWLLLGALGAAAAGSSYPIYSVLFSNIVTVFYQPNLKQVIWKWCLKFIGLGLLNFFALLAKVYCLNFAGEKLVSRLRQQLFQALVRQDIAFFDMPGNESGALCARLATDTTLIQNVWGGAIGAYVQATVCLIGGLVIAWRTSWKLTLVTGSCVPALIVAGIISNRYMYGVAKKRGTGTDASGQVAAESISACRTVFAFNLQAIQIERYTHFLDGPAKHSGKKAVVFGLSFGFSQFIIFGAFALSFWYGGRLLHEGEIGFANVLKCSFGVLMGAMGVGEVFAMSGDQGEGHKAADRVYRLIDTVPSIDCTSPRGFVMEAVTGRGKFDGVSFRYPSRPEVTILRHLDLAFAPGQRVALLGATGCGKSTIISLLMRFYDPLGGRICLEGYVPGRFYDPPAGHVSPDSLLLQELNVQKWRAHCGIVSQEPILFDDTVAANIKYGKPIATDEEMYDAARKANIHEYIMSLPEGYETNVGAKGSQLSGGQKQRVAIARCIIRKPTLLLLDEATSALDNTSEQEVQAALDDIIMTDKMTVLIVAHRLSTIKNCDVIIMMSEGKILEQGSHDQLYAARGEYRRRYDQYYGIK